MKRLLIAVLAMSLCTGALALSEVDSRNLEGYKALSKEKQLMIQQEIERLQPAQTIGDALVSGAPTPEAVDSWVKVGAGVGQMLVGTAKELGMAATEFINTPIGKWAFALGIWYLFGSQIMHVVIACILMVVCVVLIKRVEKNCVTITTKYDAERTDLFGRSRVVEVRKGEMSETAAGWTSTLYVASVIAFLMTAFTYSSMGC